MTTEISDLKTARRRRRPHGDGGIRQRGAHSWEIKVDLGPDPLTGKRRLRFKTVRGTKKEALTELAKLRTAPEASVSGSSPITVAAYLESWLAEHARHRVSAKTFERYAELVHKHLAPALGAHQLAELAPQHLQRFYHAALTTPRRRVQGARTVEYPPLAAHTVKHLHRVLSQALKQAVRLRLLPRNPAEDVDPPRPQRREMRILDQAQTAALLKAAEASPIYMPVLLAVTTGMRRGECLALRWRDLDLGAGKLSVVQTLEETKAPGAPKHTLAFKAPKTERSRRTIALPELTLEALKAYRVRQAEQGLAIGRRFGEDDLVCCNALGEPLYPHLVTDAFSDLVARLGFKVRFHDLRHTHISHLLAAGVHPKIASERAGHASVSITLDVYSHVIPGMQEDAAKKIDAALRAHMEH
jgi:integrase